MGAPWHNLHEKITGALVAVIKEKADTLEVDEEMIRPGIWGEDLESPSIVVVAEGIAETYLDSGVYRASVLVCMSNVVPDTEPEEHNRRIAVLVDRLRSVNIAAELTAKITDFNCYQVAFREAVNEKEERSWIFKQMLSVVFQPTDL